MGGEVGVTKHGQFDFFLDGIKNNAANSMDPVDSNKLLVHHP
jgi:hypothetical protein